MSLSAPSMTFEAFSLSPEIQRSIKEMGFTQPSAIQSMAIPVLLEGRDLIGQAQTGTGKTAAFAIPTIERIDPSRKTIQALIMCPTRELAVQVAEEFRKLLKYKSGTMVAALYGGESIHRQLLALKKRPQIIVGTPGRLLDHIRRGSVQLRTVQTVILDEADEMLNMGFRDDIESILKSTPQPRQTVFFSATMPHSILQLTANYQNNPQHINIAAQVKDVSLIEQCYVEVHKKRKLEALTYLIDLHQLKLAIIFCNTKRQVDDLVFQLKDDGYSVCGLHGGMSQPQRDKVMNRFRKGTVEFLVATDVAARGIDVRNIEAVFNYDLPNDVEYYVHRIGRTGRAGEVGRAFTFIEKGQTYKLNGIRRYTKVAMSRQEIPATA
jgi:ATP-dependent RNA helicase DeaD